MSEKNVRKIQTHVECVCVCVCCEQRQAYEIIVTLCKVYSKYTMLIPLLNISPFH